MKCRIANVAEITSYSLGIPNWKAEMLRREKSTIKTRWRVLEAIDCEEVKINSVFRLGKVIEGKTKPVKAILSSREGKMEVFRNSRYLRNTDQFKRVFISILIKPNFSSQNGTN